MFMWLFSRRFKDRQPELVAALDGWRKAVQVVNEGMADGTISIYDIQRFATAYGRYVEARTAMVR